MTARVFRPPRLACKLATNSKGTEACAWVLAPLTGSNGLPETLPGNVNMASRPKPAKQQAGKGKSSPRRQQYTFEDKSSSSLSNVELSKAHLAAATDSAPPEQADGRAKLAAMFFPPERQAAADGIAADDTQLHATQDSAEAILNGCAKTYTV